MKQKASPSQGDAAQFGTVGEITQTIAHRKHGIMNKICLELFIFSALFYLPILQGLEIVLDESFLSVWVSN